MFMKELWLYLDQLKKMVDEFLNEGTSKTEKKIQAFIFNMKDGINYYQHLLGRKLNLPEPEAHAFFDFLEVAQERIDRLATKSHIKICV